MLSNKSLKNAVLVVILIGCWATISAWSVTDNYFGNRYGAFDPRGFAMGSASTYNDVSPFSIANNPANISVMKKSLGAQVSMNFTRNEDNRSIPMYNSFDAYIDDSVYSSNINAYDDYSFAIFGMVRDIGRNAGLGFYNRPLLSFDADYKEQIRTNYGTVNDTYPELIALNQINNKGTLQQKGLVLSMGYELSDYSAINFGFDYSLLDGEIESEKSIRWTPRAREIVAETNAAYLLPDYVESSSIKLEGYQTKFGTTLSLSKRLGVGFVYIPKTTLTRKGNFITYKETSNTADSLYSENAIDEDYILPTEMRIGISYRPQNIMRTWFNIDLEQVMWSDINKYFDDVINIYVGVEHHVENRFPLRLGFQSVQSWLFNIEESVIDDTPVSVYVTRKVITPMITGGSSIDLYKGIKLDFGLGYAWREYEALDMFGDSYYNDRTHTGHSSSILWRNSQNLSFANRGWENPDKIRESFITLSTGLTFTW